MTEKTESRAVAERAVDPFVDMVERLSTNADIDADKLQKLLDMNVSILDRNAKQAFYAAMNEVQSNLPAIVNNAWNDQTRSRYAKLEIIARALRPVYTAHGFSVSFSQDDSPIDSHIRVRGRLAHRDGHIEDHYHVDVPIDDRGIAGKVNKTLVHATGSSFTYGRRYLTCMMFDVATGDDDDGNVGEGPLEDEQIAAIAAMLKQLQPDDQSSFWRKARVNEGEYDELRADRFDTYRRFLIGKGAVE